jgi:hypothetical protein
MSARESQALLVFLLGWTRFASAQAVVSFSPTSLSFGYCEGGNTASSDITLTNTGNAVLDITQISVIGPGAKGYSQTNNCGTVVDVGANCTITVKFKPIVSGLSSADISVADTASGSPQKVPLSGTGIPSSAIVAPANFAFASQLIGTASAPQSVIVTNIGQLSLNISSISLGGANTGDFSLSGNCGSTLASEASCTITATFNPGGAWARSAVVMINDDGLGSPHLIGLAGSGVSGGFRLSPRPVSRLRLS